MDEPLSFLGRGYQGLRRSVIDPDTGRAVVTSAPTGEVVTRGQLLPLGVTDAGRLTVALPQAALGAYDAVRLPGQVARGERGVFDPMTGHVSQEALGAAFELAGTAMTGSLPFSVPKGALRSFGGAANKADDVLAALEAGLADYVSPPIAMKPQAVALGPAADVRPPMRLDPSAASWDLYHGSPASPDFQRFDPSLAAIPSERGAVFFAPDAATAVSYAGQVGAGAEAGPRVFRTTVTPGKTALFDLAELAETSPAFNARAKQITIDEAGPQWGPFHDDYVKGFKTRRDEDRAINAQVVEMGYPASELAGLSYGHGHIGAAVQMAREQGLDTAILRGLVEHGGDDQVIVLTPNRVRSAYAPDQLLYSGGPGGAVLAPLGSLGAERDRRR
jgi:hypothetical protein